MRLDILHFFHKAIFDAPGQAAETPPSLGAQAASVANEEAFIRNEVREGQEVIAAPRTSLISGNRTSSEGVRRENGGRLWNWVSAARFQQPIPLVT